MVAYWRFDEAAGTTVGDSSGTSANGTLENATWSAGRWGHAIRFSGASAVVIGTVAALNTGTFTWAAWVYVAGEPRNGLGPILEYGVGSDFGRTLSFGPSGQRVVMAKVHAGTSDAESIAASAYRVATWEHWAVSYNDEGDRKLHIYKNGQEVRYEKQVPARGAVCNNASYQWAIGATPGTHYFGFNGIIDEVRIYNRVLSRGEILVLANAVK